MSFEQEQAYLKKREWSPYKAAMPIGEQCVNSDSKIVYAHYIDDQAG